MDPGTFGKYQVRRLLGHGAFASVYLCLDPDLDSLVAIKLLGERFLEDEDVKSRFVQEARILRRLDSERILRVHTIDRLPDGRPYFVADYADGGTLQEQILRHISSSEDGVGFSLENAVVLSRDIAQCLGVAHRRDVVHRDLKPQNILFRSRTGHRAEEGRDPVTPSLEDIVRGRVRMVLADFGIARALEAAAGQTISAGTPQYMAPEQADGRADPRSDLYAAAVILFELLTGRTPYLGSTPLEVVRAQLTEGPPPIRQVREDVSEIVESVLLKGMATEPDARYQTADEWLRALDDVSSEVLLASGGSDSTVFSDAAETVPVAAGVTDDEGKIQEAGGARWSLQPHDIRGGGTGETSVVVANEGSTPIEVPIRPVGPDLTFQARPQSLSVEPSQTASAELSVSASDRRWFGRGKSRRFQIPAPDETDLEPPTLEGVFVQKPRLGLLPLSLILFGLLAVGLVAWLLWPDTTLVEAPDLVGLPVAEATMAIEDAGLVLGATRTEATDLVGPGEVVEQQPEAGVEVEEGSLVDLVIAEAPPPVEVDVPDLVGLTTEAARNLLEERGLVAGAITGEPSEEFEAGIVVSHEPVAGAAVPEGSDVSLVVSEGTPVEIVAVPNVVDLSEDVARDELGDVGLEVGAVSEENSTTGDIGVVLAQDPPAGSEVESGSSVDLVVSIGTIVPDVTGLSMAAAVAELDEAGLAEGTTTEETSASVDEGLIISQDPGSGVNVSPGSTVDLIVSSGPPPPADSFDYEVLHEDFEVGPGGFLAESVSCPSGMNVVGGGVGVIREGSGDFGTVVRESTAGTIGGGAFDVWAVSVANLSGSSHTLRVEAICVDLGGGLEVISNDVAVAAGGYERATAICPAGSRVLGGGAAVIGEGSGDHGTILRESGPGTIGGGAQDLWLVGISNTSGSAHTVRIKAICSDPLPGYEVVSTTETLGSGGFVRTGVECDVDHRVMGGGVIVPGGSTGTVIRESNPGMITGTSGDQENWVLAISNGAGSSHDVVISAVCVDR